MLNFSMAKQQLLDVKRKGFQQMRYLKEINYFLTLTQNQQWISDKKGI